MRSLVVLLTLSVFVSIGAIASAQLTLQNSATGGPPSSTTTGTLHSLDSKDFRIGTGSCLRAAGASNSSYLPTSAALDPGTNGLGGVNASKGFTLQWWYKPAAPTTFAYLWGEGAWTGTGGTFRCFQNGAAGTGNLFIRGPLTQLATTGAPLQQATGPAGWVHFACVVDTTANTVTWYVNGTVNATGPANITGKGANFTCMGEDFAASAAGPGNYDDFRIYDWARTAADVGADYTRPAAGSGPSGSPNVPDLAYYECDLPTNLVASGSPRTGGTVVLDLTASGSANLAYQLGSSLGQGPILLGGRTLALDLDDLLRVSVGGLWPAVFAGYTGRMDGSGKAKGAINIPPAPVLVGVRIHTAFITLSPSSPQGVKSISNTVSFSITQ